MSDNKPKTIEDLQYLLKDVYESHISYQLSQDNRFFAKVTGEFPEHKPTRFEKFRKKWKKFWNHIPDFYDYLKQYEYEDWRYWDKDGY